MRSFAWLAAVGLGASAWAVGGAEPVAASPVAASRRDGPAQDRAVPPRAVTVALETRAQPAATAVTAAQEAATAALAAARNPAASAPATPPGAKGPRVLSLEGRPGDVRLVVMTTSLPVRKAWVVPRLPLPPFLQWRRWLDEHKVSTHSALDWMDGQDRWWHTEVRGYDHHAAQYLVGEGEFQATGVTVYGVFIMPGRTDLENEALILDEKTECDYHVIEAEARAYGRKDRRPGDPGTGGNGSRNVGLGGPCFKPSQNSNTYVNYVLRRAGVRHPAPEGAVGWDTVPHFPYSSDARE